MKTFSVCAPVPLTIFSTLRLPVLRSLVTVAVTLFAPSSPGMVPVMYLRPSAVVPDVTVPVDVSCTSS